MSIPQNKKIKNNNLNYYEYNLTTLLDTHAGYLIPSTQTTDTTPPPQATTINSNINNHTPLDEFCKYCSSIDLDSNFFNHLLLNICHSCIKSKPEYTLLTKTESKQDYLLTESELQSIPNWPKPNPHSKTYSNMLLYTTKSIQEFAIKKWGSLEALDAEFEAREIKKHALKKQKFLKKNRELRKKTILSTNRNLTLRTKNQHSHVFENIYNTTGDSSKSKCVDCGLEYEYEEL